MTKPIMIGVFLQILLMCNVSVAETSMQAFTTKYTHAVSEDQRLQLCLDAINQGLVYRGMPLADIDKLFGTTFNSERLANGQSSGEGVINFIPFVPSPRDDMAAESEGWYLAFTFGPSGFIEHYYLTNLHK